MLHIRLWRVVQLVLFLHVSFTFTTVEETTNRPFFLLLPLDSKTSTKITTSGPQRG
ncbi:unnamed protein product [Amoebophrya sp. A25]|nr:unnamed protein product [Amoebophrya sp. A25]|eukprot:GSA25T00028060001.1